MNKEMEKIIDEIVESDEEYFKEYSNAMGNILCERHKKTLKNALKRLYEMEVKNEKPTE